MTSSLHKLTITIVLVSLLFEYAEQVRGIRYFPYSSISSDIKHSDFVVNLAPQPSGLFPGFGRFLLPPKPKMPFFLYKDPHAAAPITSYANPPRGFASNPGYEALSPSSEEEDPVPPVPQPIKS